MREFRHDVIVVGGESGASGHDTLAPICIVRRAYAPNKTGTTHSFCVADVRITAAAVCWPYIHVRVPSRVCE